MRLGWPVVVLILILSVATLVAWSAPLDPAIDDGPGPFSYFSRPSTVLGVADGLEGTQVTPEGWLYTGTQQLIFFAGPHLEPLRQRIHTLQDNHLPIVSYSVVRDGVDYQVTIFGATLDGAPESNLVNFVRVSMTPTGDGPATAIFAVAIRAEGPRCCVRMKRPCNLLQATYSLRTFCALRDDQVVYLFPSRPEPKYLILPDREGKGPVTAREAGISPTVPVCMVRYELSLGPGETQSLDFKMPYDPVPASDKAALDTMRDASFDDHLRRTERWWREYLAEGLQIELPEAKVVDTYLSSIMYDSIARDKVGDDYICKVNEFQYDGFWVRDGAYICAAFDFAGRHAWSEQCLPYFLKHQQKDGIIYQPPQLDGWGQTLWAFGQHWRLTGDDEWAWRMYPYLARSVRGIFAKTAQDPLGLAPAVPPYDNEAIHGHYTGHSLWLMTGLRDIIAMAEALGQTDDAREFQKGYERYRGTFLGTLEPVTAKTGGYLPPGLDAKNGCDWGNLLLLYPRSGVPARGNFNAGDPRVTATVNTVREKKYAEGLMTYGHGLRPGLLHHYLTMKVTENLVAQNRQQEALADLYSLLVHTSSTNAGFEFSIKPWDNRDPGGNLPPHGWFAAKYMALLRNILVREWEGDLHLLGVVSPEWVKPGDVLAVRGAPTDFGEISFRGRVSESALALDLSSRWRRAPARLIVHVPWFLRATAAEADGKPCSIAAPRVGEGQEVAVPPEARKVTIRWSRLDSPQLSYSQAVEDYRREYCTRYEAFVKDGGKAESLWLESELIVTDEGRREQWSQLQSRYGIGLACPTSASKSDPGCMPEVAVDGATDREVHWAATPYPQWWQVDLGEQRNVEGVRVVTYWDSGEERRYYQYRVLASQDGENWTLLVDYSRNTEPATALGILHQFEPVRARYLRVEMLYNSANPGVHLAEVMVFPGVEAPVAEPPVAAQNAWTAEDQSGVKPADCPQWGFVGAERLILRGEKIQAEGDRVRLEFRGGQGSGIVLGEVSIGVADPKDLRDLLPDTRIPVSFDGRSWVEVPPGKAVPSDWIMFPFQRGRDHAVTFEVRNVGSTVLWSDEKTVRYETPTDGAARAARWSNLSPSATYNIYFLSRVEVPRGME